MSSTYTPCWKRTLRKVIPCLFKVCPQGNHHWWWHQVCFCGSGVLAELMRKAKAFDWLDLHQASTAVGGDKWHILVPVSTNTCISAAFTSKTLLEAVEAAMEKSR